MIYSVSAIGDMVDFLKANPFCTIEEYMWGLSSPMIQIMCMDYSHVNYLTESETKRKRKKEVTQDTIANEYKVPIFK
jgi:hypothetical protein